MTWFAEIERILGRDSYTSHIDEVLGAAYKPEHAVRQSLAIYTELIELIAPKSGKWIAVLVIPFHFANGERWSAELDLRVPPMKEWQSEWAVEEPPTIGVYRRSLLLHQENVEEYRRPITENVLPSALGQIDIYYRVWRPIAGHGELEEYNRGVHLEYQGLNSST